MIQKFILRSYCYLAGVKKHFAVWIAGCRRCWLMRKRRKPWTTNLLWRTLQIHMSVVRSSLKQASLSQHKDPFIFTNNPPYPWLTNDQKKKARLSWSSVYKELVTCFYLAATGDRFVYCLVLLIMLSWLWWISVSNCVVFYIYNSDVNINSRTLIRL